MYVESIRLNQFRNITSATLKFGPRFTILYGANGSGKTNVLEAIYFVSTLKSFRGADLATMMKHGQSASAIDVCIWPKDEPIPMKLRVSLENNGKNCRRISMVNDKVIRSGSQFYGRLSAILFTSEDLNVLRGSPQQRRNFLDRVIFARERIHISDIQQYDKLLRSRNRILKQEFTRQNDREIEILLASYEFGLARIGAQIWTRRVKTLRELLPQFNRAFGQIDQSLPNGQFVQLFYRSRLLKKLSSTKQESFIETEENKDLFDSMLSEQLAKHRSEDFQRKTTTIGPHLDDWVIELNNHNAAQYASQGQARALMLAFKVAELRLAQEDCGNLPILLLDDVSSELDPQRSAQLFSMLAQEVDQCVITTTAAHHIPYDDVELRQNVNVGSGELTVHSHSNRK